MEDILDIDERYKRYPLFKKCYEDLTRKVKEEKRAVEMDDLVARMHLMSYPTPLTNARGCPNWKGHPVKALLEVDVANTLNEKFKPKELRGTRDGYKQFPLDVFGKQVL